LVCRVERSNATVTAASRPIHAVVTNVLDQLHFETFGGSVIGRPALLGMTTDFCCAPFAGRVNGGR
jgi:hypothetical protein